MAAKAKLLLRELKTIKADLAFAKERCAQLEEENKMLRESQEKGRGPEDDDLVSNRSLSSRDIAIVLCYFSECYISIMFCL